MVKGDKKKRSHSSRHHYNKLFYPTNSYFNIHTQVPLSSDDKLSAYSTTCPKSIHESSTYPESTHLFEDPDASDIINIYIII